MADKRCGAPACFGLTEYNNEISRSSRRYGQKMPKLCSERWSADSPSNEHASFFEESLPYPDEPVNWVADNTMTQGMFQADTSRTGFLNNQDMISTYPLSNAGFHPAKVENFDILPQQILEHVTNVDVREFQPVTHEDWQYSWLEADVSSPSSHSPGSSGPLTPYIGDFNPEYGPHITRQNHHPVNNQFHGLPRHFTQNLGMNPSLPTTGTEQLQVSDICDCFVCVNSQVPNPGHAYVQSGSWLPFRPSIGHYGLSTHYLTDTSESFSFTQAPVHAPNFSNFTPFPDPQLDVSVAGAPKFEREAIVSSPSQTSQSGSDLVLVNDDDDDNNGVHQRSVYPTPHRSRDEMLVQLRSSGYSYREIKRIGRFREAESTLRGRIRILTKHKSERIRRPAWKATDIALLHQAVKNEADVRFDEHGNVQEIGGRIPWQKVANWMKQHGSSYMFAPATCSRKWREEVDWQG